MCSGKEAAERDFELLEQAEEFERQTRINREIMEDTRREDEIVREFHNESESSFADDFGFNDSFDSYDSHEPYDQDSSYKDYGAYDSYDSFHGDDHSSFDDFHDSFSHDDHF